MIIIMSINLAVAFATERLLAHLCAIMVVVMTIFYLSVSNYLSRVFRAPLKDG